MRFNLVSINTQHMPIYNIRTVIGNNGVIDTIKESAHPPKTDFNGALRVYFWDLKMNTSSDNFIK